MNNFFYKFYERGDKEVNQGDIFELNQEEIKKYLEIKDPKGPEKFIVFSNSCDLVNHKEKIYICISKVWDLKEEIKKKKFDQEDLKIFKQNLPTYKDKRFFYLFRNDKPLLVESVIILDIKWSYKFKELEEIILKKRIAGLTPPYREKLGWMVGNLFNRISLEHDIPKTIKEVENCCSDNI